MGTPDEALEAAILRLSEGRGPDKSICPSEAARAVAAENGGDWRGLLGAVRRLAVKLAKEDRVVILRKGRRVDPDAFRGIYRIATVFDFAKEQPEKPEDDPGERLASSLGALLGGRAAAALAPDDAPAAEEDDDDPDLARAPQAATLNDIASQLERYLGAELNDATRGNAEIVEQVVGLAGQPDVEPVLPQGHAAAWRDFQRTPADEE
jgi:hypothetical protein